MQAGLSDFRRERYGFVSPKRAGLCGVLMCFSLTRFVSAPLLPAAFTKGRMKISSCFVLAVVALSFSVADAQTSSNVSVFATGFSNPRGLKWGPDRNL